MLPLPLTIGGAAAATIGSMFANNAASKKVDQARTGVLNAERQRQAGFDAENDVFNTGAQNRYVGFGDQQAARGRELGDYFAAPSPTGGPGVSLPAPSSDLISGEIAKQNGIAQMFSDQQAGALGNLRSFGDVLGGISRLQGQDAGRIAQINNFKRGSSGVTALELEQANEAGKKQKLLGDILGGSAKVGLTAGLGTLEPTGAAAANFGVAGGGYLGPGGKIYPGPGYYPT